MDVEEARDPVEGDEVPAALAAVGCLQARGGRGRRNQKKGVQRHGRALLWMVEHDGIDGIDGMASIGGLLGYWAGKNEPTVGKRNAHEDGASENISRFPTILLGQSGP